FCTIRSTSLIYTLSLHDAFRSQMTRLVRFDLSDIKIAAVVEEGDYANVRVTYKFPAPNITPGLLEGETTETWRRDSGGQWCKQEDRKSTRLNSSHQIISYAVFC